MEQTSKGKTGWGTRQPLSGIFIFLILQAYKVALTYSLARWLSFWVALFSRKDLTDFHDFSILQKCKNVWDIDVYLKPHFYKKLKKKKYLNTVLCILAKTRQDCLVNAPILQGDIRCSGITILDSKVQHSVSLYLISVKFWTEGLSWTFNFFRLRQELRLFSHRHNLQCYSFKIFRRFDLPYNPPANSS